MAIWKKLGVMHSLFEAVHRAKQQVSHCPEAVARRTEEMLRLPIARDASELIDLGRWIERINQQVFLKLEAFGKASPVAFLISGEHLEEVRQWYLRSARPEDLRVKGELVPGVQLADAVPSGRKDLEADMNSLEICSRDHDEEDRADPKLH